MCLLFHFSLQQCVNILYGRVRKYFKRAQKYKMNQENFNFANSIGIEWKKEEKRCEWQRKVASTSPENYFIIEFSDSRFVFFLLFFFLLRLCNFISLTISVQFNEFQFGELRGWRRYTLISIRHTDNLELPNSMKCAEKKAMDFVRFSSFGCVRRSIEWAWSKPFRKLILFSICFSFNFNCIECYVSSLAFTFPHEVR